MKIRTRLLAALLLAGSVVLAQGLIGLWQMQRMMTRMDAGLHAQIGGSQLQEKLGVAQVALTAGGWHG